MRKRRSRCAVSLGYSESSFPVLLSPTFTLSLWPGFLSPSMKRGLAALSLTSQAHSSFFFFLTTCHSSPSADRPGSVWSRLLDRSVMFWCRSVGVSEKNREHTDIIVSDFSNIVCLDSEQNSLPSFTFLEENISSGAHFSVCLSLKCVVSGVEE